MRPAAALRDKAEFEVQDVGDEEERENRRLRERERSDAARRHFDLRVHLEKHREVDQVLLEPVQRQRGRREQNAEQRGHPENRERRREGVCGVPVARHLG